MYAYNPIYLEDGMNNMAEMFDYVSNDCHVKLDLFMQLFNTTGLAGEFSRANPKYIAGMSGRELAVEVFQKSGYNQESVEHQLRIDKTEEYWCGWVLAYYQWKMNRSFAEITQYVSLDEIVCMYHPLHEASEDKFVDTMEIIIERRQRGETKLKTLRRLKGYSQKVLAQKANVSLRAIQQYEQRQKDINKAQGKSLGQLASVLGCRIEDLLEHVDQLKH